jgi:hypothetical protein
VRRTRSSGFGGFFSMFFNADCCGCCCFDFDDDDEGADEAVGTDDGFSRRARAISTRRRFRSTVLERRM